MKHKIIILTGKSACGKNAIEESLVKKHFKRIVTNTTRPPRKGETNGVDYNFISETDFFDLLNQDKMIEYRKYNTTFGTWYYGSSDNNIDLSKHNYVIILTLDGVEAFVNRFGAENCLVFYIDCPKKVRENRAKTRFTQEEWNDKQKDEWNRRVITDNNDFPIDRVIKLCNFKIENYNKPLNEVVNIIMKYFKFWTV